MKRVLVHYQGDYMPERGTSDSVGYDLKTVEDISLPKGECAFVSLGIKIALPHDIYALVFPRSSLFVRHGVLLTNGVGVIDPGYRGGISAHLYAPIRDVGIEKGTRIVQLVFQPVYIASYVHVNILNETERGEGGYGSTGL